MESSGRPLESKKLARERRKRERKQAERTSPGPVLVSLSFRSSKKLVDYPTSTVNHPAPATKNSPAPPTETRKPPTKTSEPLPEIRKPGNKSGNTNCDTEQDHPLIREDSPTFAVPEDKEFVQVQKCGRKKPTEVRSPP